MGKDRGRSTANKIIDKVVLGKHNMTASCPKDNLEFKPFFEPWVSFERNCYADSKKEQKNSTWQFPR